MKRRSAFVALMMMTTWIVAADAGAQTADHLQCYRLKDSEARAKYSATLTPGNSDFPVAPGCKIKVPAKMLCVDTAKSNVTPAPPGAPAGNAAQSYLCYKAKCPKMAKKPWAGRDQFGARRMTAVKTTTVCAPVTEAATCTLDSECPGPNNDCQAPVCDHNVCSTSFSPAGEVTASQTAGDCQQLQCDGEGNVTSVPDNSDVPADDGLECTTDACIDGVPSHANRPDGFPCSLGSCALGVCLPL